MRKYHIGRPWLEEEKVMPKLYCVSVKVHNIKAKDEEEAKDKAWEFLCNVEREDVTLYAEKQKEEFF
jgi:hypothetical protein